MEQFVIEQIKYGLKYLPVNLLKYPFVKKHSRETDEFRKKEFVCGVCHPTDNFAQLREANIRWIRIDISEPPVNDDGTLNESYVHFKEKALLYKENGIKVMAVTPYPKSYIDKGIDVRTKDGEEKLRESARFLIKDLQGVVSGLQITNEMGIPHFTLPLTIEEAAGYIGVQLEEMYPLRGDIIIGYNSAGPQADLHMFMKPYYKYCDYIGIDMYLGCFDSFPGFFWMFDAMLDYLWAMTRKPIMIMEFGYISGGKPASKNDKLAILKKYGAESEADAKKNIVNFVENLPKDMKKHIKYVCKNDPERYFNLIFRSDLTNHLYKELPAVTKIPGYDHTPEGQAKFYDHILMHFYKKPYMIGAFVYCYADGNNCHICGQHDCPTETRWGLVDRQGNPKPSYYAVKKAFGKIEQLVNAEGK